MQWINQIIVLFSIIDFPIALSETPSEALMRYIQTDKQAGEKALNETQIQEKVTANILNDVYQKVISDFSWIIEDINEQVQLLQDELNYAGITNSICQQEIDNLLNSDLNLTLFSKVDKEKIEIYDKILSYIVEAGTNKIDLYHSQVTKTWTEMVSCQGSENPATCIPTIFEYIQERIQKCPQEYEEAVQGLQAEMKEHENAYKNRSVAYVEEMKGTLKPLVTLMKTCVHLEMSRT
nr:uncharacterized protein LOC111512112 [Leptinotarsa decemlineata]